VFVSSADNTKRVGAPLTLPCGVVLPNRLVKAGMSEQLADRRNGPSDRLVRLYERWLAAAAASSSAAT
jgi:2,4-dienoyl-CoA reductase-like NADH-dependent reductase (Old Yellow Enzyme family)